MGAATRSGGLYATHMRNESAGLFEALDEAIVTARAAGDGTRLQVSHLKCGAAPVWGRAAEAVEVIELARAERPRRRRRPVSVHGRGHHPRDHPAAGPPRPWRRGVCRRARRSGGSLPRADRDGARQFGLGERGVRTRLGRDPDRVRGEPPGLVRAIPRARSASRSVPTRRTSLSMPSSTTGSMSRSSSTA